MGTGVGQVQGQVRGQARGQATPSGRVTHRTRAAPADPSMEPYPHQFATALFSFLYHLASYDAGGEALVSCGMMEALLKVGPHLGLGRGGVSAALGTPSPPSSSPGR